MKRWLFHVAALVFLVCCLALSALWVRSASWMDTYTASSDSYESAGWGVMSADGELSFHLAYLKFASDRNVEGWSHHKVESWGVGDPVYVFPGFRLYDDTDYRSDFMHVYIAYPWLIYLFAALPILWCFAAYRRRRIQQRRRRGLCTACGYDLQGSEGNSCPECGTVRQQAANPNGTEGAYNSL